MNHADPQHDKGTHMYVSVADRFEARIASFTAVLKENSRRELRQAPVTRLFDTEIIRWTRAQTASEVVAMARAGECATIQFVNAHCINLMHRDPEYRKALARADFILPDGSGLALAAKLSGYRLDENLNGTDLFPDICKEASEKGISLYLLGGAPGVANAAASVMKTRYPALKVVGCRNGFWQPSEEDELIQEINRSGAGLVMIGLGVPLQEKWIARKRDKMIAPIVMGVGGLFDYYSGRLARAPKPVRAIGCEWIWRLMLEPRRLFARYVVGNPIFLARAIADGVKNRRLGLRFSLGLKRYFDMCAILACLPFLLPIFILIMLAIKLDGPGPVFFSQTRIGMDGIPFRMHKFRSMRVDAEKLIAGIREKSDRDGVCFKMRDDPRVTRVGKVLRRFSLDELPQLINVLKGEMSLVGPRPALPREVICYSAADLARLRGIPGLTCSWQVCGRAEIPFGEQVVLDATYLQRRSLLGDALLLLKTIPAVLSGRGAY